MAVTINNTGIVYNDGTSTSTNPVQVPEKFAWTSRSDDVGFGGNTGWVNYLSVSFTTTRTDVIMCTAHWSASYESSAIQPYARIVLSDGTTSPASLKLAVQFDINRAIAGHGFQWSVQRPAGSYTATLQVGNFDGGSTWITNYWGGADTFGVRYF